MWTAELEGGELPESRANGRSLARWAARSLAVIVVDPEDGGRAACDTTNNVRFARATGGRDRREEGREEEQGKTSAAAAILSAHSSLSPLIRPWTIDLGNMARGRRDFGFWAFSP